jgi:hypothetical protein
MTYEIGGNTTRVQADADIEGTSEVIHVALEEPAIGQAKAIDPGHGPHQRFLLVFHLKILN